MKRILSVLLIAVMFITMMSVISLASKNNAKSKAAEEPTAVKYEEPATKQPEMPTQAPTKAPETVKPTQAPETVKPTEAPTAKRIEGWENSDWSIDENGTLTITGSGEMSAYSPFYGNAASIKKVVVADGITTLNLSIFSRCENLTEFVIADSVTHIDSGYSEIPWFKNQPDGMVYIGNIAYRWKGDIPEEGEIKIKDGTKIIGSLLYSNNGLRFMPITNDSRNVSVIIPNSVTTIEEQAFCACSWMKEITIPKSVTSIEKNAFEDCNELYMRCEKNSAAQKYAEKENIPYGLINGTKADNTISGMAGKIKWSIDRLNRVLTVDCTGVMPDFGIIGAPWKDYTPYIETVILSDGVTNIGDNAFSECKRLKSIKIPNTVTKIGSFSFDGCCSLQEINLPDDINYIGSFAFSDCKVLPKIQIPDGVCSIEVGTFFACENLHFVEFPKNVSSIMHNAFTNCVSLEKAIVHNPNCEFEYDIFPYVTIVYGYPGSTLQAYAEQNGLLFKEIGSDVSLPGDVSGDGEVTAEDARLALRAAVGLETYAAGSPEFLAADASKDGVLSAEDARLILRAAVGLEVLA